MTVTRKIVLLLIRRIKSIQNLLAKLTMGQTRKVDYHSKDDFNESFDTNTRKHVKGREKDRKIGDRR